MSLSVFDFFKKLSSFYQPYFGLKGKKLRHSILAGMILTINVLIGILFAFINASINALIGVLSSSTITYMAFFNSLLLVGFYLTLNVLFVLTKQKLMIDLYDSLSQAIDKNLLTRWIKNKAFYGIKFIFNTDKEEALNPAQIISHDSSELTLKAIKLTDDYIVNFCLAITGFIGLYQLSPALYLNLFSLSLVIPGYLAFGTILYSLAFIYITSVVGRNLNKLDSDVKGVEDDLNKKARDIITYTENIALKKGEEYEYQKLKGAMKKKRALQSIVAKTRFSLEYINFMHFEVGFIVPLILSVPNLIAKKMNVDAIFNIVPYFQSIVSFFAWKNENFEEVSVSDVLLRRFKDFTQLLEAWDEEALKIEDAQLTVFPNTQGDSIRFNHLTLNAPDGRVLMENVSFDLKFGQTTLLAGPSGVGKSSLLRAIAKLWPYLKRGGEVHFPGSSLKMVFIPQHGFMYCSGTSLLDTILYPSAKPANEQQIEEIKRLMKKAKFQQSIIDDLEKVKDWNHLSGGERQRIAIISAIIKKPDVLFMDESTNGLDKTTKSIIEKLLKRELPNAAIGAIAHNSDSDEVTMGKDDFYDDVVLFKRTSVI